MDITDACCLAVDHIVAHGLSDITKEGLEVKLIAGYKQQFLDDIKSKVRRASAFDMDFKPIQHILAPKNRYVFDYRKAAIIGPSCLAKYTALVLMAAKDIEAARIPVSENILYSARFAPDGDGVFDKDINYGEWRKRVKTLADASDCSYVVQCDIASFYDRVNIHRIESTLADVGVDKGLVRQINDLLLLWSRKDSYGLPVGNTASRILAEAALIDVDSYLMSEGVRFIRYVDDYRIFAPSLVIAQRWMNLLTARLFRDGLMLNTSKTKIYLAQKSEEKKSDGEDEERAEVVIRKVNALTGGYSRIVRTFLMPAEEKFEAFRKIDIRKELNELSAAGIPEFSGIQKLIIACLVQKKFDLLEEVAIACCTYMYALDYFVDMLKKNEEFIPIEVRNRIADNCAGLVAKSGFGALEWHQACLASLLGSKSYFRKQALIHVVRTSSKESVTYPSILALEGLQKNLNRTDFRTIREWFDRCDDWEKRRLIALSEALPDEERKAWGRAIKPMAQNDFLVGKLAADLADGRQIPVFG